MQKCASETEQIVAVLHDVLEDTEVTSADLKRLGFSKEVIRALQCLTKAKGEDYQEFISRVSQNPLASRIKILDLIDNMDCSRLTTFGESDAERMQRYANALRKLRGDVGAQTSDVSGILCGGVRFS